MDNLIKKLLGHKHDRPQAQELLTPWSWNPQSSGHMDMCTNTEALGALLFGDLHGNFTMETSP